jgi:hypothetical protein
MEWIDVLTALNGIMLALIIWLLKDRVSTMDRRNTEADEKRKELKTEVYAHISKESAMLRDALNSVDGDAMQRDAEARRELATLTERMPQQYILRQEFEAWKESVTGSLKNLDRKMDRLLDAVMNRRGE